MRSKAFLFYAINIDSRLINCGLDFWKIKWIGVMRVGGNCVDQCFVFCTRSSSSLDSRWRFLVAAATPPAAAASEAMASCCWWCSCAPGSPAAKAVIPGTAGAADSCCWWAGLCWWGSSWWGTPIPATWGKLGPRELWWWWWPWRQTPETSKPSISMRSRCRPQREIKRKKEKGH